MLYVVEVSIVDDIGAVVFHLVVPLTVLLVNALVVCEVRRASNNAARLQHHQATSSNSAVPTVMLVTISVVYVLICSTWCVLYLAQKTSDVLDQCLAVAAAVTRLVFAYNFYVYFITGKQFRSELIRLFSASPCLRSSTAADQDPVRRGRTDANL